MILVKRISYGEYLTSYKEGGGLYQHYQDTKRDLPTPLTETEWVEEQGSIGGPILSTLAYSDKKKDADDESVIYAKKLKDVVVPDGWSEISEKDYAAQMQFQEDLADRLQSSAG